MKSLNINSKKGFTIIEVVLVLAIAGLIFLMVFIALPNMQKSQRDTQRRNDFATLAANMSAFMTNNNGKLPTALTSADSKKYINDEGKDPNGFTYNLNVTTCASGGNSTTNCALASGATTIGTLTNATREAATKVYVVKNAGCDTGHIVYRKSSRAFAIYGNLEAGNGTYCQQNQ